MLTLWQEGSEGVIRLKHCDGDELAEENIDADDPEAIKLLIDFFYLMDYDAPPIPITVDDANARMRTIQSLFTMRRPRTELPKGDCNTLMHAKMYALGEKYGIPTLKTLARTKFATAATYAWNHSDFARTIQTVYCTTPDDDTGLREIVVQTMLAHKDVLCKKKDIEEAIMSVDKLSYGLWQSLASRTADGPTSCDACGKVYVGICTQCGKPFVRCDCNVRARCLAHQ